MVRHSNSFLHAATPIEAAGGLEALSLRACRARREPNDFMGSPGGRSLETLEVHFQRLWAEMKMIKHLCLISELQVSEYAMKKYINDIR